MPCQTKFKNQGGKFLKKPHGAALMGSCVTGNLVLTL